MRAGQSRYQSSGGWERLKVGSKASQSGPIQQANELSPLLRVGVAKEIGKGGGFLESERGIESRMLGRRTCSEKKQYLQVAGLVLHA